MTGETPVPALLFPGALRANAREFGSAVSLGLGEQQAIAALSGGTASPFSPQLAELRASGAAGLTRQLGEIARSLPGDTDDWEAPDRWLTPHQEIGMRARTLTAIATPGHTRGAHDVPGRRCRPAVRR